MSDSLISQNKWIVYVGVISGFFFLEGEWWSGTNSFQVFHSTLLFNFNLFYKHTHKSLNNVKLK